MQPRDAQPMAMQQHGGRAKPQPVAAAAGAARPETPAPRVTPVPRADQPADSA